MNYYNEHNPKAVQWLRALIEQGSIPAGDIDERNIQDVTPKDLAGYRQCHFFAGIGGWSLALRLAGISDEHTLWTGSCPCQPFSVAGQGLGEADERHLWPYFRNLIGICRPPIVIGEQVAKKAGLGWLARVRSDMERGGYAFGGADLCAPGVGSPNIRQRLYWFGIDTLAHSPTSGPQRNVSGPCEASSSLEATECVKQPKRHGNASFMGNANRTRLEASKPFELSGERRRQSGGTISESGSTWRLSGRFWDNYETIKCKDGKTRRVEPGICPLAYGFPGRVDLIKGFGNAINPILAAEFIQAAFESLNFCAEGT